MNRSFSLAVLLCILVVMGSGCPPGVDEGGATGVGSAVEPGSEAGSDAAAGSAFMTINSKPWSVVFLDGQMLRNTPLSEYPISDGEHELLLRCGNCTPVKEYSHTFHVAAGETYSYVRHSWAEKGEDVGMTSTADAEAAPTGDGEPFPPPADPYAGDDAAYLTLNSKPWSHAFLDGKYLRVTPVKDRAIPPGEHAVELRCGGCDEDQTKAFEFTVSAGETYTSVRNAFE